MKISIGPFTRWVGPYQIADLLKYVGVSDDKCHAIGGWLSGGDKEDSWVLKVCEWIESKKSRKIKIHIDKYDTWNMDSTLALIILPMLKQLKATKHGAPMSMLGFSQTSEQCQMCFPFYSDDDANAWNAGHAQWDAIMDEMIWAFEQLQPDCDWEEQYWKVKPELDMSARPEDEGAISTPIRWKVRGECDMDGRMRHADRIQNGLNLFGQYYLNLWD